ncbi:DNA-directed RNA polymerase I subunit RPA1-like [Musca autumnalis]|uniref:DNA-directed RNA polymerase I subunit RPA1-like n=1 Tax=Musca autumnalis TaxID=221902 RepID=UPI003CED034A
MLNSIVESYVYDKKLYLWTKLIFNLDMKYKQTNISFIIKYFAKKTVDHQVDNIKRATDGINIVEIFKHNTSIVSIRTTYTPLLAHMLLKQLLVSLSKK